MTELTETETETDAKPRGQGGPKLRSRKHGAAIPLDDTDRRLMNLMQSEFPLDPEPYAKLAAAAELPVEEFMERTRRLLDGRIIREITPIFDTRALGYSSMLVAAKVDHEYPHRPATIINSHPGVSHNYLRDHEFNLWFTIATPPDSRLGLEREARLQEVHQRAVIVVERDRRAALARAELRPRRGAGGATGLVGLGALVGCLGQLSHRASSLRLSRSR